MKKQKKPLVCIVIVNWNGGDKIIKCLNSLKKTKYNNYKVILVDNNSTNDSTSELLKINKNMDVIKLDKNYGYTIGTNSGWKYALKKYNPKYICAMDSDIVTIQADWLDLQIKELEKYDNYGISCGKLVFEDDRLQLLFHGRDTANFSEKDCGQYDFVKEVPAVGGACIIIKTSVIKKMGYYDENFFYGPNDLDYCFRAKKNGFKTIYNGKAKCIHIGSSSYLASEQTKIFEPQTYGNLLLVLRHFGFLSWSNMLFRQILRIVVTRKNPYAPIRLNNLNFHRDILKRAKILAISASKSLKNRNLVINHSKTN